MASQNDVPMAEKAVIVGAAFLGVQMKCARCHDAPAHDVLQKALFELAPLLGEKPIKLPSTSSVPLADPNFAARAQRRLPAEQLVDSLFHATGKPLETEEVNLDLDGRRAQSNSINLGKPRRAWQFASTSNERDRPSLALPRVQAVVDVLQAFGWRSTRQDAQSVRDNAPNLIQPAVLANGTMGVWLTRLSDDHGTTQLALEDQTLDELVDRLFLRILTRKPRADERSSVVAYLSDGYTDRRVDPAPRAEPKKKRGPQRYVSWSNHLSEEANMIKVEREVEARRGDPPTDRLNEAWRRRLEDVLWTMLNSP